MHTKQKVEINLDIPIKDCFLKQLFVFSLQNKEGLFSRKNYGVAEPLKTFLLTMTCIFMSLESSPLICLAGPFISKSMAAGPRARIFNGQFFQVISWTKAEDKPRRHVRANCITCGTVVAHSNTSNFITHLKRVNFV